MIKRFSPSSRYAFALASVAVATLIRLFLNPFLAAEFPFFTYYVAVALTICFSGFGPSLVTVALGYLSADIFFYYLHGSRPDPLSIFIYLCVTLTISLFGKSSQDAKYRMELSMKEARQRQRELQEELERRHQAEAALQLSEEQFRASFSLPGVGAAQIDPSNGRFLRINARLCEMTGYSPEELLNMTVRQITFPGDGEWDSRALRKMIEGVAPEAVEKRYVCKGGRIIWVSVAAALIRDKDGRPWRTTAIIRDETARRQAEEASHAAQLKLKDYTTDLEHQVVCRTASLSAAVQTLEQFCYSVANDLRAPIRAMQGYAMTLAEDVSHEPAAVEYARRISQSASRVDQLVCDLMIYGRMACEPIQRQPVSLGVAVDSALATLQDKIKSRNASINCPRPLPHVMGDSTVIEHILVSMLQNAITFVGVDTQPMIQIRTEETPATVRLSVQDNGIGIEPQFTDKIFSPLERLHPQKEYPGAGIGLAIVKRGIERLGGTVGVCSEPGKGSCFWFELPVVKKS